MGKRHYFSISERIKYCPKCPGNVSLNEFRVVNESREEWESGRYHSRCKTCENKESKQYQLARKLNETNASRPS